MTQPSRASTAKLESALAVRVATRERYRAALHDATGQPVRGDPEAALDAFLTLNAGYFLGEWLSARAQARLVRRLATDLTGLADLPLPADPVRATQLAQHVRELATELGPTAWTAELAARTAALVPDRPDDWDAVVREAARRLAATGDARPLLLAHARRRLWELEHAAIMEAHPASPAAASNHSPMASLRRLARAAIDASGQTIQVTEVALAEISQAPHLAADLLPACQTIGLG